MTPGRIRELRDHYRSALLGDTVPFWTRHSPDREHGGFFTCLGRDGSVYGTDKPVWLQGRAVWTYATLYQGVERRPEWLALAQSGHDFLQRHCVAPGGKMYFLVTRDGRPLRMRRYVFSEVFGTLAAVGLALATGDSGAKARARELFDRFLDFTRTPGRIPPKTDPRTRPLKSLSPLMCLLNLADSLRAIDPDPRYERLIDGAMGEIFRDFVRPEDRCILEHVGPDGARLDEPDGRIMNPGHAIEAAWFILDVARRRGDRALVERALPIVDWSLERGWDRQHGGLLYFVDVAGKPPPQLEHDMKLWWPHCEALVALLLAWQLSGAQRYAEWFERVHAWAHEKFADPEYGEWFGYLRRDGSVSSPAKGGIWKGMFHLPRAQLLCWRILDQLA